MTNAKRMIFSSAILLIASMLVAAAALAAEHQRLRQGGLQVEVTEMMMQEDGTGAIKATVLHVPKYAEEGMPQDLNLKVGSAVSLDYDPSTRFLLRFGGVGHPEDIWIGDRLVIRVEKQAEGNLYLRWARNINFWQTPPFGSRSFQIESVDTDGNRLDVRVTKSDGTVVRGAIFYENDAEIWKEGVLVDETALETASMIRVTGDIHVTADSFVIENVDSITILSTMETASTSTDKQNDEKCEE